MSATYPATAGFNDGLPVRISRGVVQIGDAVFSPENKGYIAEHGVTVQPGDDTKLNQVTVTFLVGQIDVEDDALSRVKFEV